MQTLKEIDLAAEAFGVNLQSLEIRVPRILKPRSKPQPGGGLRLSSCQVPGHILNTGRKPIVELATKSQLPAIYESGDEVDAGGLMTYGPNTPNLFRRSATYVDKILKGAKPADLPVEQPTKFEFIINLKAAKQIGLTIPPNVLARADRVIQMNVLDCKMLNCRSEDLRARKLFDLALCALCSWRFAFSVRRRSRQGKSFRIGFLDDSTASGSAVLVEGLRQELSKLGWIEGKNIAIEYRFAERKR